MSLNIKIILANRDQNGIFYTWLRDSREDNDIDCIVNANVLLYLGESDDTRNACRYINDVIIQNKEGHCSIYYPSKFSFYYMVSRAYFRGVRSLGQSKELMIHRIVRLQNKDGSFGDELDTAMAVCSLLNFVYKGTELEKAITSILDTQNHNGSWPRRIFFYGEAPYYGSQELTTAICIEALTRYLKIYERS